MRKADLVNKVAEIADLSSQQADEVVSSTFEHVTNALARGDNFSLVGFGSFSVKKRAARVGRNPKTGEPLQIGESNQVSFKAGKSLRDEMK